MSPGPSSPPHCPSTLLPRSIAASYSHVQVQSTIDAAKLAAQISSGVDDEAMLNGGKRPRVGAGGLDAMAAMEAEALQAEAAAVPKVMKGGSYSVCSEGRELSRIYPFQCTLHI